LTKTIEIPARSVAINVACKIRNRTAKKQQFETFTGVYEPCDKLLARKYNVQSESVLLNVKKGKSHVNILNPNDYPVRMYRNQTLGQVECVTKSPVNLVAEDSEEEEECDINELSQYEKDKLLFEKLELSKLTHLTPEQMCQVQELILKHRNVFALTEDYLKAANIAPHKIVLDTEIPIRAPYRPIPMKLRPHAEKLCKKLMSLGIIEPTTSAYHSPAFIQVKRNSKGGNAKYRLISDLRMINAHVQRSYQPLPDIESLTTMWEGCKYFSKMDLSMGYWQQPLHEDSKKVTACSIPSVCTFQYARVPLGLTSSPGSFQQEIEKSLLGIKNIKCANYLDDLATASVTFEQSLENLDAIFERLGAVNLVLKPEKTRIMMKEISFLGFILSHRGLEMDPKKCDALIKMSRPRNKKQIKSFVSMAGFYRKFLKGFADICKPLTDLLKNNVTFKWDKEQDNAFQALKDKIAEKVVLKFPDLNKEFILQTDASLYSTGAILSQYGDDGFLYPVAFASNLLTPTQQRWSTFQRELYSMKIYCEKFRVLLLNQKFTIQVDHKPLEHWQSSKLMEGPLWRWFQTLMQYQFTVKYVPGPKNIADCPSRLPRTNDKLFNQYVNKHENLKAKHAPQLPLNETEIVADNNLGDNATDFDNSVNSDITVCYDHTVQNTDDEQSASSVVQDVNTEEVKDPNNPEGQSTTSKRIPCRLRAHHNHVPNIATDESIIMVCQQEENENTHSVQFTDKKALSLAQEHDPILSEVRKWVKKGTKPDIKDSKTQRLNPDLKTYRDSYERLKIEDDVLYRSWEKQNEEQPDWLICLPEYYHEIAIKLAHDIPSSGHLGKFKTLERLRKSVYFPRCELQVSLYIDSCKPCILKSRKQKPKAPLNPFYGSAPNDIVQFDLMGPFGPNKYNYTMIFVIVDKFTGWAEAVALKDTNTAAIARCLLDVWVSRNGLFTQCHSDNGPSFTSEVMKIVMKLMGNAYHSHTCPFTPKSNGGAEAMVRIVKDLLRAYCAEHGNIWPDMLQQCMFAYRSSVSTVTGYSPHFLHTGQKPKVCLDLLFNTYEPKKFETHGEYAYDLFKKLHRVNRFVEDQLKANRDYAKTKYDRRVNAVPFEPGQFVYVWRPKYYDKSKNPFKPSFYGPFKIIKKVTDYTYKIDVGKSKIKNIVPHDLLRLAPQGQFEEPTDFEPSYIDQLVDRVQSDHQQDDTNNPHDEIEDSEPHRPIICVHPEGRPVRNRRPPDRYQAGF
jgi:hypothetical protein